MTSARPQVEGAEVLHEFTLISRAEGGDMASSQVGDMYEVADGGPIRRLPVSAEHL